MSKKIHTLLNSGKQDDADSGEESDGGGERQGFFVGGSEHSGQQVLGPPGRPGRANIAERVFDAARQHGAEALNSSDLSPRVGDRMNTSIVGDTSTPRPGRSGGGVRLGEPNREDYSSGESESGEHEEVVVELIMWENGFSIDDGPLRSFDDPASQQFLESIMQGRVPAEILAAHPRRRIDFRMQKRSGPYEPPKLKPFQGAGARLGAVVPEIVSSTPPPSASANTNSVDNVAKAQAEVNIDADAPVTQVQIRLPNGQRVSGKFNQAHTVGTIRTFLVTAYPDMAATPFQLMTTFPNKVIDDESIDLKDAGLINAVVVAKLCS
ncbi:hypothetical protein V3C99_009974 [Haemonchus contortus]